MCKPHRFEPCDHTPRYPALQRQACLFRLNATWLGLRPETWSLQATQLGSHSNFSTDSETPAAVGLNSPVVSSGTFAPHCFKPNCSTSRGPKCPPLDGSLCGWETSRQNQDFGLELEGNHYQCGGGTRGGQNWQSSQSVQKAPLETQSPPGPPRTVEDLSQAGHLLSGAGEQRQPKHFLHAGLLHSPPTRFGCHFSFLAHIHPSIHPLPLSISSEFLSPP